MDQTQSPNAKQVSNYLSFLLGFAIFLFAWVGGNRFPLPYSLITFKVILLGGIGIIYLLIKIKRGENIEITRYWWLLLVVFFVLAFSVITSQNFYASMTGFLYFISLGFTFLLICSAFKGDINPEPFFIGILFLSFLVISQALWEVISFYSEWWRATGFLQIKPPYMYRYIGLLNSSNYLLAWLNLIWPVALTKVIKSKDGAIKVFVWIWLAVFVVILFFSSSRGGYVGFAAGAGVFAVLNIQLLDLRSKIANLNSRQKIFGVIAIGILLISFGFVGYQYLISVGTHPSHGGTPGKLNLNRVDIWRGYLNIWKDNKVFGAGLNRNPFEYLESNQSAPPGFWPTYSHGMIFGSLAEFGVIGTLPIFGLILTLVLSLVQHYQKLEPGRRLLGSGILAGIITLGAHSLVDDFLRFPTVIVFWLVMIAWYFSLETMEPKPKVWVNTWIVLLFSVILIATKLVINLPYQQIDKARSTLAQGFVGPEDFEKIGGYRDYKNHFKLSALGYLNYQAWIETDKSSFLEASNSFFQGSLEIEPAISTVWMNKAFVSWQLGNNRDSLIEVEKAIELAPDEPVYHLNYAIFLEEMELYDRALEQYEITLIAGERWGWQTHPFWELTEIRSQALSNVMDAGLLEESTDSDLHRYQRLIGENKFEDANFLHAQMRWKEDKAAVQENFAIDGLISLREGDSGGAYSAFERSMKYTYTPIRLQPLGWWGGTVYQLTGWDYTFVEGVIELSPDYGQIKLVRESIPDLVGSLTGSELDSICREYQLAVSGGDLEPNYVELPKGCR